jgi:hypothetical protein
MRVRARVRARAITWHAARWAGPAAAPLRGRSNARTYCSLEHRRGGGCSLGKGRAPLARNPDNDRRMSAHLPPLPATTVPHLPVASFSRSHHGHEWLFPLLQYARGQYAPDALALEAPARRHENHTSSTSIPPYWKPFNLTYGLHGYPLSSQSYSTCFEGGGDMESEPRPRDPVRRALGT